MANDSTQPDIPQDLRELYADVQRVIAGTTQTMLDHRTMLASWSGILVCRNGPSKSGEHTGQRTAAPSTHRRILPARRGSEANRAVLRRSVLILRGQTRHRAAWQGEYGPAICGHAD